MADVRSLLRNEQASRRITHPNVSYTKSGLLTCLVCNLIIKSESLWEGHLRSANHKNNLQKAQNGEVQNLHGTASKKRKMLDEAEDVRKKRRSTGFGQGDSPEDGDQAAQEEQALPRDTREDVVAGMAMPDDESTPTTPPAVPDEASVPIQAPHFEPQPQIDEDEWTAFEREVVPLTHQDTLPRSTDYSSATISAAPVSAAELVAQTDAERQHQRDAEIEDEKAEEETRLAEEFEVMEGLEERVRRLKEKREALRIGSQVTDHGAGEVEDNTKEKPPDLNKEEGESDESDEVDEWGFT